jgi:hypothetical protein
LEKLVATKEKLDEELEEKDEKIALMKPQITKMQLENDKLK